MKTRRLFGHFSALFLQNVWRRLCSGWSYGLHLSRHKIFLTLKRWLVRYLTWIQSDMSVWGRSLIFQKVSGNNSTSGYFICHIGVERLLVLICIGCAQFITCPTVTRIVLLLLVVLMLTLLPLVGFMDTFGGFIGYSKPANFKKVSWSATIMTSTSISSMVWPKLSVSTCYSITPAKLSAPITTNTTIAVTVGKMLILSSNWADWLLCVVCEGFQKPSFF